MTPWVNRLLVVCVCVDDGGLHLFVFVVPFGEQSCLMFNIPRTLAAVSSMKLRCVAFYAQQLRSKDVSVWYMNLALDIKVPTFNFETYWMEWCRTEKMALRYYTIYAQSWFGTKDKRLVQGSFVQGQLQNQCVIVSNLSQDKLDAITEKRIYVEGIQ